MPNQSRVPGDWDRMHLTWNKGQNGKLTEALYLIARLFLPENNFPPHFFRFFTWFWRPPGGVFICVHVSRLTIDHASLSRRSTVPTPNRDTSNIWALITLLPYTQHRNCLLILSPSCFAVCGHHLSPRIAIVFSLLSESTKLCYATYV